jgi:hypothetical protein
MDRSRRGQRAKSSVSSEFPLGKQIAFPTVAAILCSGIELQQTAVSVTWLRFHKSPDANREN